MDTEQMLLDAYDKIERLCAENAHLDAALADTAAQLTDAVQRAQEAEHNYSLLAKQADAFHAENAQLRQELDEAHALLTTVATQIDSDIAPVTKADLKNAMRLIAEYWKRTSTT